MNSLAIPLLLAEAEISKQIALWLVILLVTGFVLTPNVRAMISSVVAVVLAAFAIRVGMEFSSPLVIGTMLGAMGLIAVLPPSRTDLRAVGAIFFVMALGFYGYALSHGLTSPAVESIIEWVVFGILAITAVGSAIAMIASRSAVYSAIWFAVTLLTTGGLFLYQGAQFLGVATVTVYAGAIVVTFLFVIMLAQPDGHASYDRISWGWFAKPAAAIAAVILLGAVLQAFQGFEKASAHEIRAIAAAAAEELAAREEEWPLRGNQIAQVKTVQDSGAKLQLQLTDDASRVKLTEEQKAKLRLAMLAKMDLPLLPEITTAAFPAADDPQASNTMAHLGGHLFSRQLIAVEVAGTLLLAALVGAIAMLSQGAAVSQREGGANV